MTKKIQDIVKLFKSEAIINGINIHNIMRTIKFVLWVVGIIIVIVTKDVWVEIFSKSPELSGIIMWVIVVMYLIRHLPIPRRDEKKERDG